MKKLAAIRKKMQDLQLEAFYVSNPVNVAYISGFTGTAGILLIAESHAWLLTDFRYIEQAKEQAPAFEVVDTAGSGWEKTADLLAAADCTALAVEADHLTVDTYEKMGQALPKVTLQPLPASPAAELRVVKSEAEIQKIAAAQALTDEAFAHILSRMKPGVRERDIALELEYYMRKHGASGNSFEMIVASGSRAALPHGVAGDKKINAGDAVVLDFGCVKDGYCSDMTRTVFVGDVSHRQQEVYEAVLAAQEAALGRLKAGMNGREADALSRKVLEQRELAGFFGHGLGHGVGREIHEAPRLSPKSEDVLLSGMVVTVEPGVYLPREFGVRIEDMVVVTDNGIRNLTRSSKELFCL